MKENKKLLAIELDSVKSGTSKTSLGSKQQSPQMELREMQNQYVALRLVGQNFQRDVASSSELYKTGTLAIN